MKSRDTIEQDIEKRYKAKDRRKRPRMKVTGKQVFTLQRLLDAPKKSKRPKK